MSDEPDNRPGSDSGDDASVPTVDDAQSEAAAPQSEQSEAMEAESDEGQPVESTSAPGERPEGPVAESSASSEEHARSAAGARFRRWGAVELVMALLLALLGFSLVVQWRTVATDPSLATARQEDLVRILSDLDLREDRLRQDITDLEQTRGELTTAGQSREAALEEATRRADELGILAGRLPAQGPGIRVRMVAAGEPISAATLLDAVQELRGAGAEAMQVLGGNGVAVRVVASTYFVDAEGGIVVDGALLPGPYLLTVIGDPSTLAPALNIPGGVVESVRSSGGTVILQDEPGGVTVSAVRVSDTLRYARPVS